MFSRGAREMVDNLEMRLPIHLLGLLAAAAGIGAPLPHGVGQQCEQHLYIIHASVQRLYMHVLCINACHMYMCSMSHVQMRV